jgi:hypothetical protein
VVQLRKARPAGEQRTQLRVAVQKGAWTYTVKGTRTRTQGRCPRWPLWCGRDWEMSSAWHKSVLRAQMYLGARGEV